MSDEITKRVEAMYEREERPIEAGIDRVGQMTVAFCGNHATLCCNINPPG